MNNHVKTALALGAIVLFAAPVPVLAQKSQDTVRLAFLEATQSADPYTDPKPENNFLGNAIWDTLIDYDEAKHRYAPLLAKSWKRIDEKTYEFELRGDVKWHDGQAFTADDVVYTFGWITDPKSTNLRFRADWGFIDKAEKVAPGKIRITTKVPAPNALETIAYRLFVFPEHLHKPLTDKESFGTKPVGTGMLFRSQGNYAIGLDQRVNTLRLPCRSSEGWPDLPRLPEGEVSFLLRGVLRPRPSLPGR